MKTKHLLLLLLLPLLGAQCEKEEIPTPPETFQLPPITQTGEHTFGCLLNGEVWVPRHYSNSVINPPVVLQAYTDPGNDDRLSIFAKHWRKDDNSIKEDIDLNVFPNSISDTTYFTNNQSDVFAAYVYSQYRGGSYYYYFPISSKLSWIYLSRFDTIKGIASGTFSIDLLNINSNQDSVHIREGRFDILF